MSSWNQLGEWWKAELTTDPAYEEVVTPLLLEVLQPQPGSVYLDLGCGDGRVMVKVSTAGATPVGVELASDLARLASEKAPTVIDVLPDLKSIRSQSVDGAYSVLVLEHLPETSSFFAGVARVVRPGGVFGLVINHPAWTAPGSTPITDEEGETLWRPGDYFTPGGASEEPAGDNTVTFYHRTTADLLNDAAAAGWSLERMIERPHHEFEDQAGIPRLMACRWQLLP
jgi:SAM-dependent methyltransferase